jgi:hypothetical protein
MNKFIKESPHAVPGCTLTFLTANIFQNSLSFPFPLAPIGAGKVLFNSVGQCNHFAMTSFIKHYVVIERGVSGRDETHYN